MSLTAGTRIGHYEVMALIGVGGMGEVYRARDNKLNRDVALKILPEAFALDADRLARFKREAQVLASLNHPNIAAIYGFEDSGRIHALVLELVEGETLAERIGPLGPRDPAPATAPGLRAGVGRVPRSGPAGLPLEEALPIAHQMAEAIEAAHEHGVVHRDLKPLNVKITPDGIVKVLDFGLAKLTDDVGRGFSPAGHAGPESPAYVPLSQSPTITNPGLMTGMGVILGTAAYMSPEQAKGRPADKRADVWAFGCVLETLENKNVSNWSPDGRFILYANQSAKTARDIWALPLEGDRSSTGSGRPEPAEGRKPFLVVQTAFEEVGARFSPDGRWIAYEANETGRVEVFVHPFPGPGRNWQISTNGGVAAQWRGDGREIFYRAPDNRLMAVPVKLDAGAPLVDAGNPVALFPLRPGATYAATPDGQRFLINTPTDAATASPITVVLNWKPGGRQDGGP